MRLAPICIVLVGGCLACGGPNAAERNRPVIAGKSEPTSAITSPDSGETTLGSATGMEYFGGAQLARIARSLSKSSNPTYVFGRHPAIWYVAARRVTRGSAEVHDRWMDVTFVQAGNGTLLSGGTVTGSHPESGGEHRGGSIRGGSVRSLGAGDFIVIPARMPHQYQPAPNDSLVYLTVKVLDRN